MKKLRIPQAKHMMTLVMLLLLVLASCGVTAATSRGVSENERPVNVEEEIKEHVTCTSQRRVLTRRSMSNWASSVALKPNDRHLNLQFSANRPAVDGHRISATVLAPYKC